MIHITCAFSLCKKIPHFPFLWKQRFKIQSVRYFARSTVCTFSRSACAIFCGCYQVCTQFSANGPPTNQTLRACDSWMRCLLCDYAFASRLFRWQHQIQEKVRANQRSNWLHNEMTRMFWCLFPAGFVSHSWIPDKCPAHVDLQAAAWTKSQMNARRFNSLHTQGSRSSLRAALHKPRMPDGQPAAQYYMDEKHVTHMLPTAPTPSSPVPFVAIQCLWKL